MVNDIHQLEQRLKEVEAREADKASSISALEEQLKSCEFRRREQRDNFRKLLSERKALLERLERYEKGVGTHCRVEGL